MTNAERNIKWLRLKAETDLKEGFAFTAKAYEEIAADLKRLVEIDAVLREKVKPELYEHSTYMNDCDGDEYQATEEADEKRDHDGGDLILELIAQNLLPKAEGEDSAPCAKGSE